MQLPIQDIIIDPQVQLSNRRVDEETVQSYVVAIQSGAQLPPVVVFEHDGGFILSDGFHRIAACRFLGYDAIEAEIKRGNVDAAKVYAAIANVTNGRPMSQAQKREAGKRLIRLTDWSDRKIARRLALNASTVSRWRSSVANATDKSATRTVTRGNSTYQMDVSNIGQTQSSDIVETKGAEPDQGQSNLPDKQTSGSMLQSSSLPEQTELIHGDFAEVCHRFDDDSFDAIITDPPYPKEFLYLYELLASQSPRLLKPGGILLAMAGQSYLPEVMSILSQHLVYRWTIAYMVPAPHVQVWDRQILCGWKPVIMLSNGKDKHKWAHDVVKSDSADKEHHEWGQSTSGMTELVKRFTEAGDLVLDPFLGGGATAMACHHLARRFVGVDIDQLAIERTKARLLDDQKEI